MLSSSPLLHIGKIYALLLVFLLSNAFAAESPTQLSGIRISPPGDKVRVVLTLSGVPKYEVFTLAHPNRIVIDLSKVQSTVKLTGLPLEGTDISAVRVDAQKNNKLRVVVDLKKVMSVETFTLPATQPYGERLILDLHPVTKTKEVIAKTPVKLVKEKLPKEKREKKITVTEEIKTPLRNVIVVIDPGHGGQDPGAKGMNGTEEKDIVLAIAKELRHQLNNEKGFHALLTRTSDYYIGLRPRIILARKDKADLFVAVHADAYRNPYSSGASVYALSANGASSEAARWLAEKENYSELGGINLEDKSDMLRSVLIDLSQTGTISLSLQLGSSLLQEMGKITRLHHHTVEQARFVVLKSLDIPSVLVETGFISNAREESKLRTPEYQRKLAAALKEGIIHYFKQYPPPGTVLAEKL